MGKLLKKILFHCCDDLISLMDCTVARAERFLKETQCEKNTVASQLPGQREIQGALLGKMEGTAEVDHWHTHNRHGNSRFPHILWCLMSCNWMYWRDDTGYMESCNVFDETREVLSRDYWWWIMYQLSGESKDIYLTNGILFHFIRTLMEFAWIDQPERQFH